MTEGGPRRRPLRVAIAGGTGLVGDALAGALRVRGDDVLVLSRKPPRGDDSAVQWDPSRGIHDIGRLEGLDGFVNVIGERLADRPWTRVRRARLRESRIEGTAALIRSLSRLSKPPAVFLGAGHLGVFGDRGEDVLDEDSPPGEGFLAELARDWEGAHAEAASLGSRVAVLRMGIVLGVEGGAFPLMVHPFRIGIGGWIGHGRQYTPWITLRDATLAFVHLLDHDGSRGVYNGTVPEPTRNREWLDGLGRALNKPLRAHAPRWALRGAFGEYADGLLLGSVRALPRRLLAEGFAFSDPSPDVAFQRLVHDLESRGRR